MAFPCLLVGCDLLQWPSPCLLVGPGQPTDKMLFTLLTLTALLHAGLGDHEPGHGETCTEVIVTGDEADATCTCTCVCDVECPPVIVTTTEVPPPVVCTAGIVGKNVVQGYDGGLYHMNSNNKFLANSYGSGSDQCKFQIRIDTEDDPANPGEFQVGWMGAAFGVHNKNDAKFERNFRVSLTQGVVELRGRGTNPVEVFAGCYQTGPFPLPWKFCLKRGNGDWHVHMEVPDLGCIVHIDYVEAGVGNNLSANDQITIEATDYYVGKGMRGMCGDKDGKAGNDPDCSGTDPGAPQDCVDGDHQNNG